MKKYLLMLVLMLVVGVPMVLAEGDQPTEPTEFTTLADDEGAAGEPTEFTLLAGEEGDSSEPTE